MLPISQKNQRGNFGPLCGVLDGRRGDLRGGGGGLLLPVRLIAFGLLV